MAGRLEESHSLLFTVSDYQQRAGKKPCTIQQDDVRYHGHYQAGYRSHTRGDRDDRSISLKRVNLISS